MEVLPMNHPRPFSAGAGSGRSRSPLSLISSVDYTSSIKDEEANFSPTAFRGPVYPNDVSSHRQRRVSETRESYSTYPRQVPYHSQAPATHAPQPTLIPPQRMALKTPKPIAKYKPQFSTGNPGQAFKKLPKGVLLVVLAELKKLHLESWAFGHQGCATCLMRDLVSLGQSCKMWWDAAKIALYENIQLHGNDSTIHLKKKYKMKYGTRLKLLRRTLRSRPDLAQYVKSLKVPAIPEAAKDEQEGYSDLVASLVMACPNLERLPGFFPGYTHEFSRLAHALSTRSKLTERVWVIDPSSTPTQSLQRPKTADRSLSFGAQPALLGPDQCIEFLTMHSNWSSLRTLFLHCNPGGIMESGLLTDALCVLPSLENLVISSFPRCSFDDSTLISLPPVKCLRLQNLPGVTSQGISNYSSSQNAKSLKSLSLVSLPLSSLPALARLFQNLTSLESFIILQASSPYLPADEAIFMHPYMASSTLKHLHWEFTEPDDDKATDTLAKAIKFGGFPALRTIRAPTDFNGTLQALCRPRHKIELVGDRYRNHLATSQAMNTFFPVAPAPILSNLPMPQSPGLQNTFMQSPTRSHFSSNFTRGHSSSDSSGSNAIQSPTSPSAQFSFGFPDGIGAPGSEIFSSSPTSDRMSMFGTPTRSNTFSSFTETTITSNLSSSNTTASTVSEGAQNCLTAGFSLASARRMAQSRSDNAVTKPRFHVIVWDSEGAFSERFAVGGFLGDLQSQIYYSLQSDVKGSDVAIVGLNGADNPVGAGAFALFDDSEERNTGGSGLEGCCGTWNVGAGEGDRRPTKANGGKGKKLKDYWWHTERGTRRDIPLSSFF